MSNEIVPRGANTQDVDLAKPVTRMEDVWRLSQALSQSTMVPDALRNRPQNCMVLIMTGQELGLTWTQAIREIYVTPQGKPNMMGEFLLMRLRQAGHDYDFTDPVKDHCDFRLHRDHEAPFTGFESKPCGKGRDYFGHFSIDDAVIAGLCSIKDGKPFARSQGGKPLNWEAYGSDMLFWRSVSRAVKRGAPEVTMGFGIANTGDDTSPEGPVVPGQVLPQPKVTTATTQTGATMTVNPAADELAELDAEHGGEVVDAEIVQLHPESEPVPPPVNDRPGFVDPPTPPAESADTAREATTPGSLSVPAAASPSAAPTAGEDENAPASTALLTSLGRQFKSAGYNDRAQRAFTCSVIARHWITKPGELTTADANAVIAQLAAWRDLLAQGGDERPGDSVEMITVETEALRVAWEIDEPEQFGGDQE